MAFKLSRKRKQIFKCKNCRRVTNDLKKLECHVIDCRIKIFPSPGEFLRQVCDNIYIYDNKIKS